MSVNENYSDLNFNRRIMTICKIVFPNLQPNIIFVMKT